MRDRPPATGGPDRWTVAVAVKPLAEGKTRLAPALSKRQRADLVCAMAVDVIHAVREATVVDRCIVVTADRRAAALAHSVGAEVLAEPYATGLNEAFVQAAARVGPRPLALVVADLPGLTGHALAGVLAAVPVEGAAVVGDAELEGTTILAARSADTLRPRFGVDSFARHLADGAVDVSRFCPEQARCDLDTAEALSDLAASGAAGFFTAGWLARSSVDLEGLLSKQFS